MNLSPKIIPLVRRMCQLTETSPRELLDRLLFERDAWPRLEEAIRRLESENDGTFSLKRPKLRGLPSKPTRSH